MDAVSLALIEIKLFCSFLYFVCMSVCMSLSLTLSRVFVCLYECVCLCA